MPEDRLPSMLMFGAVEKGAALQGGQKRRWKDVARESMVAFDIAWGWREKEHWVDLANDRVAWRAAVQAGTGRHHADKNLLAETKRVVRKTAEMRRNVQAAEPVQQRTLLRRPPSNTSSACPVLQPVVEQASSLKTQRHVALPPTVGAIDQALSLEPVAARTRSKMLSRR
jgi:hypothetical protein